MVRPERGGEVGAVLVTEAVIGRRVAELGASVTEDYAGKDLVLVGVLSGGAVFTADLARSVNLPLELDWIAVSSYGDGSSSSGRVRLVKDVEADLAGRHVLVVDDILDTGVTLAWLLEHFRARRPASLHACVLLRKPEAVLEPVRPRYVGLDIEPVFVAGYGIDYAGRYRNLRSVHKVLLPEDG